MRDSIASVVASAIELKGEFKHGAKFSFSP